MSAPGGARQPARGRPPNYSTAYPDDPQRHHEISSSAAKRSHSGDDANSSDGDSEISDHHLVEDASNNLTQLSSHTLLPEDIRPRRTRTLMTPHQLDILNNLLSQTRFPTTAQREEAGRQTGLPPRKVQVWFQNQRQKQNDAAKRAAAGAAGPSTSTTNTASSSFAYTTARRSPQPLGPGSGSPLHSNQGSQSRAQRSTPVVESWGSELELEWEEGLEGRDPQPSPPSPFERDPSHRHYQHHSPYPHSPSASVTERERERYIPMEILSHDRVQQWQEQQEQHQQRQRLELLSQPSRFGSGSRLQPPAATTTTTTGNNNLFRSSAAVPSEFMYGMTPVVLPSSSHANEHRQPISAETYRLRSLRSASPSGPASGRRRSHDPPPSALQDEELRLPPLALDSSYYNANNIRRGGPAGSRNTSAIPPPFTLEPEPIWDSTHRGGNTGVARSSGISARRGSDVRSISTASGGSLGSLGSLGGHERSGSDPLQGGLHDLNLYESGSRNIYALAASGIGLGTRVGPHTGMGMGMMAGPSAQYGPSATPHVAGSRSRMAAAQPGPPPGPAPSTRRTPPFPPPTGGSGGVGTYNNNPVRSSAGGALPQPPPSGSSPSRDRDRSRLWRPRSP